MAQSDHDLIWKLMRNGDVAALRKIATILDTFPDRRDELTGDRWITLAIAADSVVSVRWMIARGVDLNFRADDGYTPIHTCLEGALSLRHEMLRLLIDAGCDLDAHGPNDWTPLHAAAVLQDLTALQMLLDAGADPSVRSRIDDHATPEEEARLLGKHQAADFLAAHVPRPTKR